MMTNDVTCMMLTIKGRESWARLAVESFRRRSYADAELLIVNQGDTVLSRGEHNIREVFVEQFESIGAARNFGLSLVTTPLVMHWDDDDFHGAQRIELQVKQYRLTRKPNVFKHFMISSTEFEPCVSTATNGYVGTVCYPSDCGICYPNQTMHEDYEFVRELKNEHGLDLIENDPATYVRFYHGGNTCTMDHMKTHVLKGARVLNMRERWHHNAIRAYCYEMQHPKKCETIEDIAHALPNVPFMTYARAKYLRALMQDRPKRRALEIGTCHGVGACYLSRIFEHVDTIDLHTSLHKTPNIWDSMYATQVTNVRPLYRPLYDTHLEGAYDLVYIDGDHSKRGVESDLHEALRVCPNGVIILDDIDHPVYRGIRETFDACALPKFEHNGWGVITP